MELREHTYKIKGMNMDLSNSIFSPEFSWRNKNIRLTVRGSNDTLLVSNERGNKVLSINEYFRDPSGIGFTYSVEFKDYIDHLSNTIYSYRPEFKYYLDVTSIPMFVYSASLKDYSDVKSQPTYSYSAILSNYINATITT